MHFILFHMYL
ncbi:hypothetical protein YPPY99_2396, partial [Yersinia pestis PY-99]